MAPAESDRTFDLPTFWRTALLQLIAVAALSLALGLALPESFAVGLFALWCARLPRGAATRRA